MSRLSDYMIAQGLERNRKKPSRLKFVILFILWWLLLPITLPVTLWLAFITWKAQRKYE